MFTLTLPLPVSANRYWASRVVKAKTSGKSMPLTYVTAEAKAYKERVAWMAKAAGIHKPIEGRVRVDIKLYPNRPKDWERRARLDPMGWDATVQCIDLDNSRKVLYDALKGIAFGDDKWVWQETGQRMPPDEHQGRVVVVIRPIVVAAHPQQTIPQILPQTIPGAP
ncbi:RusA family crossover junction endodeoxyribonuclease [Curvibacter sp. HBC61]|uniref:RusA family crossover junction endodeoxyribonuclease n=1 Tax=Curvibacter cyanobacteriorum TaxID=3026422 RepID=A0ABT5MV09_9BURK|nr:RusA family crossover junction endodeoxyribonuclease [Curvibacter sp. HBC61]MDD0837889.1 RusA family crossover junction endodeoxyribonuclease [Curvibacter sp. HBC61]